MNEWGKPSKSRICKHRTISTTFVTTSIMNECSDIRVFSVYCPTNAMAERKSDMVISEILKSHFKFCSIELGEIGGILVWLPVMSMAQN